MIIGLSTLIGIVGVVLTQVIDLGQPGSDPESTQPSPTSPPSLTSDAVEVVFDPDHTSNGLYLGSGGDVDTEIVIVGEPEEQAWRTGNGRILPSPDGNSVEDSYMEFQIDDDYFYRVSSDSQARIEIEYLDEGTDEFNVQYDAESGGPYGNGILKDTDFIAKTDSGDFKTAVLTLDDAYFANRNNGADFRINDNSDGAETIRSVTVTLLTSTSDIYASPQTGMSGEEYYEQANSLLSQGKSAEAIEYFDRALDAGFENADLHHLKAVANHLILGNFDAAIEGWTAAIDLDGSIQEYWRERGILKSQTGDPNGALDDLNRALEFNPNDPIAYRGRSIAYSELGEVEAAIDDAIKAARIEPHILDNYLTLTAVYRINESPPRQAEVAMELLEKAIEFDPTNPDFRFLRGEIYFFEWGDELNAQKEFDFAIQYASPGDVSPYNNRALFYVWTGQCALAVEDYTRSIEMVQDNPWVYQERGDCYAELGEDDLARYDYETFLIMTEGNQEFDDLRQIVQSWIDTH